MIPFGTHRVVVGTETLKRFYYNTGERSAMVVGGQDNHHFVNVHSVSTVRYIFFDSVF